MYIIYMKDSAACPPAAAGAPRGGPFLSGHACAGAAFNKKGGGRGAGRHR